MAATSISWRTQSPPYALAESWLLEHAEPGDQVLSERGSLDLSQSRLRVTRVENLGQTLGGSYYALQANRWVVVPEWWSTDANLDRLDLVAEFRASWTLGGNRGVDYFIYAAGPLRPLESAEIVFGSSETADVLGPSWTGDDSELAGVPLPASGGAVFLPGLPGAGVDVEVLIPTGSDTGGESPIRLWAQNQAVPLEIVETDGERILLRSGPIPVSSPEPRVTRLYLQAASDAGPVRIVRISLRSS
jgi:hypothetical protein